MICIKTGSYGKLPNGLFIYGDAFAMSRPFDEWPDTPMIYPPCDLLLRVRSMSDEQPQRIQIDLDTWGQWFEEDKSERVADFGWIWTPSSTLIANAGQWNWLGYDGQEPSSD